jgi:hypothetical protein
VHSAAPTPIRGTFTACETVLKPKTLSKPSSRLQPLAPVLLSDEKPMIYPDTLGTNTRQQLTQQTTRCVHSLAQLAILGGTVWGNTMVLFVRLYINMISLPRQGRNKNIRGKALKKGYRFLIASVTSLFGTVLVRNKTHIDLSRHLMLKQQSFYQDRLGTNRRKP